MSGTGVMAVEQEGPEPLRWLIVSCGMFALLVVGIHAGADRLDDQVFQLLNVADALADRASAWAIAALYGLVGASAESIERATFAAADAIDMEAKLSGAKHLALGLELAVDMILALPIFSNRRARAGELADALRGIGRDPTLLRVAGPIAVGSAALAGMACVARELQVAAVTHARADWASAGAKSIGLGSLALVAIVLGARAMQAVLLRADRIARNDRLGMVAARKRRMRGWVTLVFAVPVAVLALASALPLFGELGASLLR